MGKLAFAVQVAEFAAAARRRALVVSLEMSGRDLPYRSINGRANVSAYRFRTGRLSQSERFQLKAETNGLVDLNDMVRIADKSQIEADRTAV